MDSANIRVLVVDDDEDVADTTSDLLELSGHEVQVAYNGRQAVEKARSFQPSLVILDITMPEMDGYQTARLLRLGNTRSRLSIVAHSGLAQAQDVENARQAGFDYHLAKPAQADRLVALAEASVTGDRLTGHLSLA